MQAAVPPAPAAPAAPTRRSGAEWQLARRRWLRLAAWGALLAAIVLSVQVGAARLSISDLWTLLQTQLGWANAADAQAGSILWNIRLPRVLLGLAVGAGLAASGAATQGLLRNPLAEPGLMGVSSGAALMAALVLLAVQGGGIPAGGVGLYVLPVASFIGGLAVTLAVYRIAMRSQLPKAVTLILAGVGINALVGACIGLAVYFADDAAMRTFTFWSLGNLGVADWPRVGLAVGFVLLPALTLLRLARPLNAMALGEHEAFHLGVDVGRVRRQVVWLSALSVGGAVALCGMIGFVGLVVPHLVRLVLGADHRQVLPYGMVLGATLLLAADLVARTVVAPAELPIGILTALFGAPFLLWLIMSNQTLKAAA